MKMSSDTNPEPLDECIELNHKAVRAGRMSISNLFPNIPYHDN